MVQHNVKLSWLREDRVRKDRPFFLKSLNLESSSTDATRHNRSMLLEAKHIGRAFTVTSVPSKFWDWKCLWWNIVSSAAQGCVFSCWALPLCSYQSSAYIASAYHQWQKSEMEWKEETDVIHRQNERISARLRSYWSLMKPGKKRTSW